ncbi:MAG: RNA pyrophosphohydrolase, partial [Verrucomicrobiales bacterium]
GAVYDGQEQSYFLCRVKDGAPEVNLEREPREFSQFRWIYPEEFRAEWLPDFKKDVYREVLRDFFGVSI